MAFELLMDGYKTNKTMLKKWYLLHKLRVMYKKKINRIYNNIIKKRFKHNAIQLNIKEYKKKWSPLSIYVNPHWYKTFSYTSGIEDINYVPEDLFYGVIEPTLNDFTIAVAYSDKNLYDKFYADLNIFPETLLRNMDGIFYNSNYECLDNIKYLENYLGDERKVIVKPALESGGGKNVQVFYRNDNHYYNGSGELLSFDYLKKKYKKNFLIQKYIESSDYFKHLNDTSLNTMRIYTYRSIKTNEVFINNGIFRIGKKGTEIDNVSSGGIYGLIYKNGKLSDYALDSSGNKYFHLPWNPDIKFSEVEKIPKYEEIIKFSKEIAKRTYYQRILGLDICLDNNNNIKLVEINNEECEINGFQLFGSSIFGEYTDEVIEYCSDKAIRRIRNIRK